MALPWYVYLGSHYSNPIFGRSSAPSGRAYVIPGCMGGAGAVLGRSAAGTGATRRSILVLRRSRDCPAIVTAPHREALAPAFWPILYTETWGDYFGVWAWGSVQKPMSTSIERRLTVQSIVGILPTFLVLAGLLALAALAITDRRDRIEIALVPLMALTALAGAFYYARSAGSMDGDTVKALFLLPALPAFAVCFGFAVDVIRERVARAALLLAVPLAFCGVVSLLFGIKR